MPSSWSRPPNGKRDGWLRSQLNISDKPACWPVITTVPLYLVVGPTEEGLAPIDKNRMLKSFHESEIARKDQKARG